jgi:hypothetical protein
MSQRFCLVVAAPPIPPTVQWDRHDTGVCGQLLQRAASRVDEEAGQPPGQPGKTLLLEPQAKVANLCLIRPECEDGVEANRAVAAD